MSNTKHTHTPAPWALERDRHKSLSVYAGSTFVGEVSHDADEPSPEQDANARLIAAAPRMYEELKFAYRDVLARIYLLPLHDVEQRPILEAQKKRYETVLAAAEGKV